MSQCKKFAPNIFHKTKCSNCFRQKEEHSAEALECNRASRSIARSGYLFVAPDWDFSVPLNRTKRWQRRWFVLYDDGELNYSVDEHPETVPQGSVDMSKVLEVTAAEQITGHAHSVALTSPDRVTFIKAASREDARWWVELLAMFPRRHKRNATFPGGRASPSLPQLGRSASPQPPRPRMLSCTGPSPRTNFETPPLKEERESPPKDEQRPAWLPRPSNNMLIETVPPPIRNEYVVSSGSPPTRDKLRCDDKVRARRDWRNERLRDIATALTDRSPESSLALPAEGLLHLKKGWLWLKNAEGEWVRRWIVLCLPTLSIFRDQDEQELPEYTVELSSVTNYSEVPTENKYGFEIHWSGLILRLSAVTSGIRANWLEALKKAAPTTPTSSETSSISPTTPRSVFLSSDEEYRTASEDNRRFSGDWAELPPSPPLTKTSLKERSRITRSKFSRCQSRQNTVDSTSTDELDCVKEPENIKLNNALNKQNVEINDLHSQLSKALSDKVVLEEEIARLKKIQSEAMIHEIKIKELIKNFEHTESELNHRNSQAELRFVKEQRVLQRRLSEAEEASKEFEDKFGMLSRELQTKQRVILNLQEDLTKANERFTKTRLENDRLYKRLQELEGKYLNKCNRHINSFSDLTNVDLEIEIDDLGSNELKEYCLDLKCRFEKAITEIRAVKRKLRESHENYDKLELMKFNLENNIKLVKEESQAEINLLVNRLEHITAKLMAVEKQARNKSKTEQRDKRRSLSLKGKESFSINKEVEDKVTELEAKIVALERGRSRRKYKRDRSNERSSPIDDKSLRRLRRKSLDSATSSEPLKLLMRLTSLESKVTNVNASMESLSNSINDLSKLEEHVSESESNLENVLVAARRKLCDCLCQLTFLKNGNKPGGGKIGALECNLNELNDILSMKMGVKVSGAEVEVIHSSANMVVKQLETILTQKLAKLNERKRTLKENNKLDVNARLHILAEKIAFENILVARIQEALNTSSNGERLVRKEIRETAHLINALQHKLNGTAQKQVPISETSAEHLSKVLTKALIAASAGFRNVKNFLQNKTPSLKLLLEEQRKINEQLNVYKSVKLPQLAESLAGETMNLMSDKGCRLRSLTEETKHQFTQMTREIVNVELMQAEINHVLMRTAQVYRNSVEADHEFEFSFFASERAALELWSDSVADGLYEEINRNIVELGEAYQNSLNKLQRQNWRRRLESERNLRNSGQLLEEFADIIAHKSLIDARIDVLRGKFKASETTNVRPATCDGKVNLLVDWIENDDCWSRLDQKSVQINQSLEAEFACMLNRYSRECGVGVSSVQPELSKQVLQCFNDTWHEIVQLQRQVNVPVNVDVVFASWHDLCAKCLVLRDSLVEIRCALKNSSFIKSESSELQRPVYLGTEYLSQVENLRSAYRCVLASCKERHQERDIEQLRLLCERVLVAVEQWHRKAIQELREKHAQEMELLRQEKEQALKEETQATLAALDAMRKAHEAEVQREVAKFKQDFARQQGDELQDMSEKLSVKRLEAAALNDQLGSATRQLAHAQQHIMALERNPQLASMQN